jgi:hypothetical protein
MFWDGSHWRIFASASAEAANANLICSGAAMSPARQVVGGTAITVGTVLQIPYTGGNGGSFNGATLVSTGNNNVTATIAGGMLSTGSGVLNFELSGTPTTDQQAPQGISFDLTPFLTANSGISGCNKVTVGNVLSASIASVAVMGDLAQITDTDGCTVWALQCDSPDGKFSVRVMLPGSSPTVAWGDQNLNVQLRNNLSASVPIIWNFVTFYGSGAVEDSGVVTIPSNYWGGAQGGTWSNQTAPYGTGGYWANQGIYDASNYGPEYRRYTWIPVGPDNKVSYEITVMAALDTTTPATAVSPTQLKAYIKFEQVTAM